MLSSSTLGSKLLKHFHRLVVVGTVRQLQVRTNALGPNQKSMQTTLVLAVGLDSSQFENQYSALRLVNCFVTSVGSIQQAVNYFHHGDFDLLLIGSSIPAESRERLAFLVRSLGSRIPVVYVAESFDVSPTFADAMIQKPDELQHCIETLFANTRPIATSFLE
jgi:hypothetical protein